MVEIVIDPRTTHISRPLAVQHSIVNDDTIDVAFVGIDYCVQLTPEQFSTLFEPHHKLAAREQHLRAIRRRIAEQRRQLRIQNRVISTLKSEYLRLFGEIDRALGHDLPRKKSASYKEGLAEGFKEGFAYGYDVAKDGKQ